MSAEEQDLRISLMAVAEQLHPIHEFVAGELAYFIRLVVGPRDRSREYEIGWISGIGDLPTLLREAADLIEGVATDG